MGRNYPSCCHTRNILRVRRRCSGWVCPSLPPSPTLRHLSLRFRSNHDLCLETQRNRRQTESLCNLLQHRRSFSVEPESECPTGRSTLPLVVIRLDRTSFYETRPGLRLIFDYKLRICVGRFTYLKLFEFICSLFYK